jgi:hypothetical protein
VILALAHPVIESRTLRPVRVLLDRSVSMDARDAGRPALLRAVAALEDMLGTTARLVSFEPPAAGDPLAGPSAGYIEPSVLVRRAATLAAAGESVLIVTDRPDLVAGPGAGILTVAGAPGNAGLVACALDGEGRLLVRGAARGTGGARTLRVTVGAGDARRIVHEQPIRTWPFRVILEDLHPLGDEVIEVALEPGDARPADDRVYLAPGRPPLLVGFPTQGHGDLLRAFAANPAVSTFRGPGPADLRIDGDPAEGAVLLVAPLDVAGFRTRLSAAASGTPQLFGPLAGLPLDDVQAPTLHELAAAPHAMETLVGVEGRPLLMRAGRVLVLLQDPEGTAWSSQRSFPLLMAGVADLLGATRPPGWRAHQGGEVVQVPSGGPAEAVLTDPDGTRQALVADGLGRFAVRLDRPGLYSLQAGAREPMLLTCAVLSTVATEEPLAAAGAWVPPPEARPASAPRSLEPWLLGAALLILIGAAFPGLRRVRANVRSP